MLSIGVVVCLILTLVQGASQNVALNKRVVGAGQWQPCAVDGNFHTTFSTHATEFPYYFVDLGAVYNLTSINLFAQNQWSFYDQGINVKFDVHTYENWMPPCGLEAKYPWDPLAYNLTFKRKGEEVVLHPEKPVQYIIIGTPNNILPRHVQPVIIGEIQAHGEKIRETIEPQIPEDTPAPPNYYLEVRKQILGKQQKVWVNLHGSYFKPNNNLKDVVLAWDDKAVFMAAIRQKARVVVLTADALTREINTHPLYPELKANMKKWLSPGVEGAAYVRIGSTYNTSDVLLINRMDVFDVAAIYEKLITGQNSAIIGYPPKDTDDDSAAQLLKKLEIGYVKRTTSSTGNAFAEVKNSATSTGFIPPAYTLRRFRENWSAFLRERFEASMDQEEWDNEETNAEFKKFVEHYRLFFERYAPCEQAHYRKDERTAPVLLTYNGILKRQFGDKCFPLPNVHVDPGMVRMNQKPTSVVVNIYADRWGNFFPTGVYANPGDGFKWTIVNDSDWSLSGQFLRINAQTDSISHHDHWRRWPSVSTQIPLKKTGKICSPHGGPILLRLPQGANITIRFENVYRYAWLDVRNPQSLQTFNDELKKYVGVPYIMVTGDSMDTMLKTSDAYLAGANEVIASVNHFDNAVKVMHNYKGSKWENVRKETFVADRQISAGYGHSGYPMMGHIDWSYLFTLYTSSIKRGGQPGFVHEIGHNLQVGEATLKWGGEVTNNVYHFPVNEFVLGLDAYAGGDVDQGNWRGTDYNGFGWGYYRYLGKMFGYGLVGNGFQAAIARRPGNEWEKTQFWLQQMCKETGYDMLPFHKLWRVPISEETKAVCSPLPCFFPDDKWTQAAQDIVNKTLASAGKECMRTNSKKIEFRGNITRGMNERRPQNIFLTFED